MKYPLAARAMSQVRIARYAVQQTTSSLLIVQLRYLSFSIKNECKKEDDLIKGQIRLGTTFKCTMSIETGEGACRRLEICSTCNDNDRISCSSKMFFAYTAFSILDVTLGTLKCCSRIPTMAPSLSSFSLYLNLIELAVKCINYFLPFSC